tara:strand:+ start:971 stop:1129 length:159 start_codon:yes stop_codon:yes gene_type:complete
VIRGLLMLLPMPDPKFQEYEFICPEEIDEVSLKIVGEPWQTVEKSKPETGLG